MTSRIQKLGFTVLASLGLAMLGIPEADAAPAALDQKVAALTGQPGGLTSTEVVAAATATSPDLAARQAEIENAALQVDRAIADFVPKLQLTAKYARLNPVESQPLGPFVVAPGVKSGAIPEGTPLVAQSMEMDSVDHQLSFQASLSVSMSDYVLRLVSAREAAEHSETAAKANAIATERKIALDARVLYYNWVKAELSTAVAEESLGLAEEQLTRIKAFRESGAATLADESSAVALVANTKLLFVRSQNLADLLQTQLWVTMHQEGDAAPDFSIGEDFAASVARPRQIDRLPALMSEALRRRPELRAQNAQIASLDAQASVTRARAFPRIESFASIAAQNPDSRVFPAKSEFHKAWQIGATLTFSPNETVDAVFSASQIEAKKAGAEAQAATLEDAVRMEVADARSDHRDAEASVASTAVSLAAAEEAYRARRELFLNDRATSVELNQAHNDLLRAKLDAVSATVGLRIAVAQVEHAVGRDISR